MKGVLSQLHHLLLPKNLLNLLGSFLLANTVLLSDLVGEAVLVAGDRGKVVGGQLVELLAQGVLGVCEGVGHVD